MNTIKKHGSSKSCSNRDVHQKRAGGKKKEKNKGETYMIKDYTILEVSWGQYTELRPGEIYKGKEKASKTLKEMMKEEKKYITIIHYSFHWSFAIIDNIKKN